MKLRRKALTVKRIRETSGKIALVQKAKKRIVKEEKEKDRIKSFLKSKGISFVHNIGLKKLRVLQETAKLETKKSKKQKTNK